MDDQYNWYNLEPKFKNWLLAGIKETQNERHKKKKHELTPITVKNYLSDLRHFLGWLIFKLKVKNQRLKIEEEPSVSLLPQIDSKLVEDYKSYLVENKIPVKTVNRRLSTVRKFFSFCIDQGWIKENPAKKIQNLKLKIQNDRLRFENESILSQFEEDLKKESIDPQIIKSYLDDVREFLNL